MAIEKFEDIFGWQKAQNLAVEIYAASRELKDFSYRNQIRRAAVSVSSNIAEGFDRQSNKEFIRFLYIALGSCSETKSLLYLAGRLGYVHAGQQSSLLSNANEVAKILHGLIRSMKEKSTSTNS